MISLLGDTTARGALRPVEVLGQVAAQRPEALRSWVVAVTRRALEDTEALGQVAERLQVLEARPHLAVLALREVLNAVQAGGVPELLGEARRLAAELERAGTAAAEGSNEPSARAAAFAAWGLAAALRAGVYAIAVVPRLGAARPVGVLLVRLWDASIEAADFGALADHAAHQVDLPAMTYPRPELIDAPPPPSMRPELERWGWSLLITLTLGDHHEQRQAH